MAYRPGWTFDLVDMVRDEDEKGRGESKGLTLKILSKGYDSYHPELGEAYRVWHYVPVPPATFDQRAWMRWLLDRLIEIETHEACEFLQLDGERPFAPNHGPGRNPYSVIETGTDQDARTSFRGTVNA